MVVGDKKKHLAVILTLKSLVDDNNQVRTNGIIPILMTSLKGGRPFNVLHQRKGTKKGFFWDFKL